MCYISDIIMLFCNTLFVLQFGSSNVQRNPNISSLLNNGTVPKTVIPPSERCYILNINVLHTWVFG